ncbi:MAG: hypothetical protein AAF465_05540 [Pseudomonadota bacterium]
MHNDSERLLVTVQHLRRYLARDRHACGSFDEVCEQWLPRELFPPEPGLVQQALNVLANAGEVVVTHEDDRIRYASREHVLSSRPPIVIRSG